MEPGPEKTQPSPFGFAEEVYGYSDRLLKTLAYFLLLSVYLVGLVSWLALGQPSSAAWEFVIWGFGFPFAAYFPVAVWNCFRLIRSLRRWMDDYFDYAFVVKFELLQPKGMTFSERILNKLEEVYPEVAKLAKKESKAIRFVAGITRKSRVIWDVLVDLSYPGPLRVPWIHRHLGTPNYLLVKRFGGDKPVQASDLQELGAGLGHDLRWQNGNVTRVFVVTAGEFTADVIEAVRDQTLKEVSKYPLELVIETANGYELPIKD